MQSLLSYALTVPDIGAGQKFYSTFGLLPRDGGETVSLVPAATKPADPNAAARIDYELAAQVGTKEAWDAFIGAHPSGLYTDLARAQNNKLMAAEHPMLLAEYAGRRPGGFESSTGIDDFQSNRCPVGDELAGHRRHRPGSLAVDRSDGQRKRHRMSIPSVSKKARAGAESDHANQRNKAQPKRHSYRNHETLLPVPELRRSAPPFYWTGDTVN